MSLQATMRHGSKVETEPPCSEVKQADGFSSTKMTSKLQYSKRFLYSRLDFYVVRKIRATHQQFQAKKGLGRKQIGANEHSAATT